MAYAKKEFGPRFIIRQDVFMTQMSWDNTNDKSKRPMELLILGTSVNKRVLI